MVKLTAAIPAPSRAGSLPLIGGALACDFANTASGRGVSTHLEHLRCAADVLAWARHAGAIGAADSAVIAQRLDGDPVLAQALFRRAFALRESLHDLLRAIALGNPPAPRRLDEVGRAYAGCLARACLVHGGAFEWRWNAVDVPAEAILGPIVISALQLLTAAEVTRVKVCQGQQCGWLFVDATKNRSRRWCEMEVCGNRAKQRRRRVGDEAKEVRRDV